jgi:hypothetical protein
MKIQYTSAATEMYLSGINYTIGDEVVPKDNPSNVYGKCTGLENGCIFIDGKNYGGMYFFMKSEWQEIQIIGGNK